MVGEGFKSNIIKLFFGTLSSQIVWMLAMMILARMYAPENFATYQIFISTMNIFAIFATARYEMAIIVPKYRWQATKILVLALSISITTFVVMEFCIISGGAVYTKFYSNYDDIWNYLPISVLLICMYNSFYHWNVREKNYVLLSVVAFIFPVFYLGLSVIMKKIWEIENGLIFAFILSRLVEVLILLFFYVKGNKEYISKYKYISLKKCAKEYVNFPRYMIMGGFVETFSSSLPVYLLNYFWGKDIAGYYTIAMQALAAPAALVAKSVGDVFRQHIGEMYSHCQNCKAFFDKNLLLLSKTALALAMCIILFAPYAYALVFGDNWYYSGELSRYMILGVCLSIIASPLSNIYVVSYNQKIYLVIQMLYLLSNFTGIIIGKIFWDSVELSILVTSVEIAIVSIVSIYKGRCIVSS